MASELHEVRRPQRWDLPFWQDSCESGNIEPMTAERVQRLLQERLFRQMDATRFPEHTPLAGILFNDTRVRTFPKADVVVRAGDYGNSAFLILSGAVQVVLGTLDEALIGRRPPEPKSFFGALAQLWKNPSRPEVRRQLRPASAESAAVTAIPGEGGEAVFLQDVSVILRGESTAQIEAGELFGEIAALGRTPRTGTVFADEGTVLLEIRWQGLRELRLRSPELKDYVDRIYRERSLKTHLRETPWFRHLTESDLDRVAGATEFQTHGTFDWHASYKKLAEMTAAERLAYEPVVAREGHYANGIYLVRSGFARLSEVYNHGERTVSYLGRGQTFGFDEVAHNWRALEQVPFQRTMRAVGYIDVLFVPTQVIEEIVLPSLPVAQLARLSPVRSSRRTGTNGNDAVRKIRPEMLEFLVEHRFINGTATMIVNQDRCTRCDDCVRACAATHNNNPRFLRHGPSLGPFMIANACMHCIDPVCMIGCPTGAIHRHSTHGQVVINDLTCIGCATCANSCPYDNIQMVFARDPVGQLYHDEATQLPIQKAAKCDLCVDQLTGPACFNACPHDALIRVDMRDLDKLSDWFNR